MLSKLKAPLIRRMEEALVNKNTPADLRYWSQKLTQLRNRLDDKLRILESPHEPVADILSQTTGKPLPVHIMDPAAPWNGLALPACDTPGMITEEEARFYTWIGQFYSGQGEVVELGPWLGRSTFFIARALMDNPRFAGRRLQVFDDFVWRADWMDGYVEPADQLPNGADFQALFERFISPEADRIQPYKRKISEYPDNGHVEDLVWSGAPVEMMYVDCGRTFEQNQRWYKLFRDAFIPNRTLLLMQDWRLHREVPVRWFNQTREFTESHQQELRLLHEVSHGGLACFLYTGG